MTITDYTPHEPRIDQVHVKVTRIIQPTTKAVPLLAPFLDRMITPHISSRYTASEALDAFTEIMRTLSQEFLRQTPAPPFVNIRGAWQNHDRWDGLPDDFVKEHLGPEGPVRPRRKKVSYSPDGSMSSVWVEWNVPIPIPEYNSELYLRHGSEIILL